VIYNQTWTVEEVGGTLNLHQKKEEGQGATLSLELSVNKHRKGAKAESGQAISHSRNQGR
jgi:hypothetical protein